MKICISRRVITNLLAIVFSLILVSGAVAFDYTEPPDLSDINFFPFPTALGPVDSTNNTISGTIKFAWGTEYTDNIDAFHLLINEGQILTSVTLTVFEITLRPPPPWFSHAFIYYWGSESGEQHLDLYTTGTVSLLDTPLGGPLRIVFSTGTSLAASFAYTYQWNITVAEGEWFANVPLVPFELMSLTKDPINIATGEMFVPATDYSFNAPGLVLELSRMYRSQTEFSGLFGHGWRSAYDLNLTEDSQGNVIIFDKDGTGRYFEPDADGIYTSSEGNYDTLVKNADGTFTVTSKYGIATDYNQDGRVLKVTDRNNNALEFFFDPSVADGTYIEDASGHRITLTIDGDGRIQSAQDPAGRLIQYTYDADGNLVTITDSAGNSTYYVYDSDHNIVEMTNVNGHKTYFAYDGEDRAYMNWQDAEVNKVTLDFQSDTQTTITDALGHQAVYEFNEYGLATQVTDPLGNITTTTWDQDMNRTSITDARGNTTNFEYDTNGNLIKVTDPLENQTLLSYTLEFNLISSVTDALENTASYVYDANGNLFSVTDASGAHTQMTYDIYGNLITTTDALNNTTVFEYDAYGQLIKISDALNNVTALTYDMAGNNTSLTAPTGAETQFSYDVLNRLTSINFADATSISYAYDAFGNRVSITDQKSQTTTSTYDDYERLIRTTDALGGETHYGYDKNGNLLSLTDGNGNTVTYMYDASARLLSETTPSGKTTSYAYDAAGNLASKTDPNGSTIVYTYDALNRLLKVDYPDATSVSYTYDAIGRQTSMIDSQAETTYNYDAMGRLLGVNTDRPGDTVAYTYDALGNRITMTNQNGQTINYTYDALGRLTSVAGDEGATSYTYDALSNITSVSYPNSASIAYSYDVMSRPLSVINQGTRNKDIASFSYEYDPAGMVTRKTFKNGEFIEYTYDAVNRLVGETKKKLYKRGRKKTEYDYIYSYGSAGNRLGLIKQFKEGKKPKYEKVSYSYDADNRLLDLSRYREKKGKIIDIGMINYSYDENGNRVVKEEVKFNNGNQESFITHYGYDYENRLTNLTYLYSDEDDDDKVESVAFEYNGNGLRTKAVEGNIVTQYYYDGLNVLFEKDASGQTRRSYIRRFDSPGGIGGLIAMRRYELEEEGGVDGNGKMHYYHYEALGSVVKLTDEEGNSRAEYEYDAFGNNPKKGKTDNPYRFSSKEWEPHAGLYYFGARYYDPRIGRFLQTDPIGYLSDINLYSYVGNNPVNFIDPFGFYREKKDNKGIFLGGYMYDPLEPPLNNGYQLIPIRYSPYVGGFRTPFTRTALSFYPFVNPDITPEVIGLGSGFFTTLFTENAAVGVRTYYIIRMIVSEAFGGETPVPTGLPGFDIPVNPPSLY